MKGILNVRIGLMNMLAYAIDLLDDPEVLRKYDEYHRNVFPEVLAVADRMGYGFQGIYRIGNRLFMIVEVPDDFDPDMAADCSQCEREKEWDDIMRKMQVPLPWAREGEWWAQMEPVFCRKMP